MEMTRRFLIAPSVARLIRRECGSLQVTEGHFAAERGLHVHLDLEGCFLVLAGGERATIPADHGQALLESAAGKIVYERSRLRLGGAVEAMVDHFLVPGSLDLVQVTFDGPEAAAAFEPPVWFGQDISEVKNCDNQAIALHSLSLAIEVPVSDDVLNAVLDALEEQALENLLGREGFGPRLDTAPTPEAVPGVDTAGLHAVLSEMQGVPEAAEAGSGEAARLSA
jgi:hypothetical protein